VAGDLCADEGNGPFLQNLFTLSPFRSFSPTQNLRMSLHLSTSTATTRVDALGVEQPHDT
jgi:hypothetical protein